MAWRFWLVPVAVMTSTGRYVPYGVAFLARIGGAMSRIGRYLLCEVAVLARGRYAPYRLLVAA